MPRPLLSADVRSPDDVIASEGRDITMRNSKQFRGISMDTDDDLGKPPFRVLAQMPEDEAGQKQETPEPSPAENLRRGHGWIASFPLEGRGAKQPISDFSMRWPVALAFC